MGLVRRLIGKITRIFRGNTCKPGFDGRVRIYPTLECNLSCPYCVNEHWPDAYRGKEHELLPASRWIEIIRKLNRPVVLTGGEPFLYPDLVDLVNGVPKDLELTVYTNMTLPPDEFIDKVRRPVCFLGSYHPCSGPVSTFAQNVRRLAAREDFTGSLHAIDWGNGRRIAESAGRELQSLPWSFWIDQDQFRQSGEMAGMVTRRKVSCTRRIILLAPNGVRFPCLSLLLRNKSPLQDLTREAFGEEETKFACEDWGHCAPCDALVEGEVEFL